MTLTAQVSFSGKNLHTEPVETDIYAKEIANKTVAQNSFVIHVNQKLYLIMQIVYHATYTYFHM